MYIVRRYEVKKVASIKKLGNMSETKRPFPPAMLHTPHTETSRNATLYGKTKLPWGARTHRIRNPMHRAPPCTGKAHR